MVSSTNKSDRHNITDILVKMAVHTITLTLNIGVATLGSSRHVPQHKFDILLKINAPLSYWNTHVA